MLGVKVGDDVRVMQGDEEIRTTKIVRETANFWIDSVDNKWRKSDGYLAGGARLIRIEKMRAAGVGSE